MVPSTCVVSYRYRKILPIFLKNIQVLLPDTYQTHNTNACPGQRSYQMLKMDSVINTFKAKIKRKENRNTSYLYKLAVQQTYTESVDTGCVLANTLLNRLVTVGRLGGEQQRPNIIVMSTMAEGYINITRSYIRPIQNTPLGAETISASKIL